MTDAGEERTMNKLLQRVAQLERGIGEAQARTAELLRAAEEAENDADNDADTDIPGVADAEPRDWA